VKTRILFKIGLKNVQLGEMAEAEALFSSTDQIQLEMITIRRNYLNSFILWRFSCQEKRIKYYHVVIKWGIFEFTYLLYKFRSNNKAVTIFEEYIWYTVAS
jgi:hypothetical protein